MRVLHVLAELQSSGAEVALLEAVPVFRRHAVDPIIVSTGERVGSFAEAFVSSDVSVHHVPFTKSPRFFAAFRSLVRRVQPDLVHVQMERSNVWLAVAARSAGVPVIRTIRNVFSYEGSLRRLRTVERALLRGLGVRHTAISASVARNELERLRNPTLELSNWIAPRFRPPTDAERASARRGFGLEAQDAVISSIGNCSVVKNHHAVIEALPRSRDPNGRRLVYLHAGSGATQEDERVLAAAITDRTLEVRFLGTVRDVQPLLWASDVFCMPSLYEGLGNAALEALACGVPAVLADVDGLRDVHPAGPCVRFVAPDAAGVAQGIREILGSEDDLRVRARVVADAVREERGMEQQVRRFVALYQTMISPRRAD